MIKEQFVSFDTAKMLKEAGFDVPCTSQYTDNGFGWDNLSRVNYNSCKSLFSRPTQALAARWLREVHHLNVYACFDYVCFDDGERKWFFMRENTMINDYTSVYFSIISYDSYEQALEAGLQKALKLIIKNKMSYKRDIED